MISYAYPSGLLLKVLAAKRPGEDPVEGLESLCRESFGQVETHRLHVLHSGQGDKNLSVDELIVVCRQPKP